MKRSGAASLATAAVAGLTLFDIAATHAQPVQYVRVVNMYGSGFYAGIGAGFSGTRNTVTPTYWDESFSTTPSNPYFSLYGGYLYIPGANSAVDANHGRSSYADGVVVGFEGRLDYSDTDGVVMPSAVEYVRVYSHFGGAFYFRAGVIIPGTNVIVTVNPGIAFRQEHTSQWYTFTDFVESYSSTRLGWAVGASVEAPITKNVSLRVEYMHTDYGTHTYGDNAYEVKSTEDRVGLGVSYHFNSVKWVP